MIFIKKVCLIGGGHGTSRLIKTFKDEDVKVEVVVTSSDNGGHTGEIIKEFNVPALGDLRMVLESILDKPLIDFFSYRFKHLHGKNNVSLGNLILLSMVLEYGSVEKMLEEINNIIDAKYTLYLANNEYVELRGIDKKDNIIIGETMIGDCNNIKNIYLSKEGIVDEKVINSIKESDIIVFSFGSFYTSLGAVINSNKIKLALRETNAKIVYIPNLVNQKETSDYVLEDYVDYLEKIIDRKIDRVLISNNKIKRKIIRRYNKENKSLVVSKENRDNYEYYPLLSIEDNMLRHDINVLGKIILNEK